MYLLETERLRLRHFESADAAFMLRLLNDQGWLRFIGDRGVRTKEEARHYLENGAIANYQRLGFGFYCLELRQDKTAIGMCGLSQRDYLNAPDLGFALLGQFAGFGYAKEAAQAVLMDAHRRLKLSHVLATTRLDNHASARILESIGMTLQETIWHPDGDRQLKLYSSKSEKFGQASQVVSITGNRQSDKKAPFESWKSNGALLRLPLFL